jgi:hypothetical protein
MIGSVLEGKRFNTQQGKKKIGDGFVFDALRTKHIPILLNILFQFLKYRFRIGSSHHGLSG